MEYDLLLFTNSLRFIGSQVPKLPCSVSKQGQKNVVYMHEALAKGRCLNSSPLRFQSQCLSHCLIKNIWKKQCNNKTFSHSKHYHHICWAPDSIILLKCITDVAQTKWVQDVQSDMSIQTSVSWQKAGSVAYILPAQIFSPFPSPFLLSL